MKKHIAIKLILMLAIILVAFFINSSSYAWTGNGQNVADSAYIFCRNRGAGLPYYGSFRYNEGTTQYYGGDVTEKTAGHSKAANKLVYIFNYLNRPGYRIGDNPAQKAYWFYLGQYGASYPSEYKYSDYEGYVNDMANYYHEYGTVEPIMNTARASYDGENCIYGPIDITTFPSGSVYNYNSSTTENYGFTGILVDNGSVGYTLLDENKNTISSIGSKTVIYLKFNSSDVAGKTKVTVKLSARYLKNSTCSITPLTIVPGQSFWTFCEYHSNWGITESDSLSEFFDYHIYNINNRAYVRARNGNAYYTGGIFQTNNNLQGFHTINGVDYYWYLVSSDPYYEYKCTQCGNITKLKGPRPRNRCAICNNNDWIRIDNTAYYLYYTFEPFVCTHNEASGHRDCGKYTSAAQNLIKVSFSHTPDTSSVTEDVELIPPLELKPITKFSIGNYTTGGTNISGLLNGATFDIKIKQKKDDGTFEDLSFVQNDLSNNRYAYTVYPKNFNPVYVVIKETNAPAGYKTIECPINAVFFIKSDKSGWAPTYCPNESTWADSGFTDPEDFGGWQWQSDIDSTGDTEYPNPYKSRKGDHIVIIGGYGAFNNAIQVFDKPKMDISLLKIDVDDGYKLLAGAKFKARLENVEEYSIGGVRFTNTIEREYQNGQIITTNVPVIEKDFTITNGQIMLNDVVFADESKPIKITLEEIEAPGVPESEGYYYKVLEDKIVIEINHTLNDGLTGTITYNGTETMSLLLDKTPTITNNAISYNNGAINATAKKYYAAVVIQNLRLIDLSGRVWKDGQTGLKPAVPEDGLMNDEDGIANVVAILGGDADFLKQFNNEEKAYIKDGTAYIISAKTNSNGEFKFIGLRYNKNYLIIFNYDGINYIATKTDGDSSAVEVQRDEFNNRFKTITYKKSNDNTSLEYNFANGESKLITLVNETLLEYKNDGSTINNNNKYSFVEKDQDNKDIISIVNAEGVAFEKFTMSANTETKTYTATTDDIYFGLVTRGADIGIATDLTTARVTINDKEGIYTYNNGELIIGKEETFEKAQYNLNLYNSDYNYRIRDYVTNENMHYVEHTGENGLRPDEDEELRVFLTYKVDLKNESLGNVYINEIKYVRDSRLNYDDLSTYRYNNENNGITHMQVSQDNDVMTINFDSGLKLEELETNTLYLVFEVNLDAYDRIRDTFSNTVEITSYSTDEGYIDTDSQPANCSDNEHEDDCDRSGGLTITVLPPTEARTITGYAFDKDNNTKVNGVIVQLIELKQFGEQTYEYIWQEGVSGYTGIKTMAMDGNTLNETSFTKGNDGEYKFEGYIPGDYFIRFIYGDGTTYDYKVSETQNAKLTIYDDVHNGQDYKAMVNAHYNDEYYNKENYLDNNSSIARDNEARRLETMANYVEIDKEKGTLLKLLDTKDLDKFNEEEIKVLLSLSGKESFNELTEDDLVKLLDEKVLPNTWMCAESAKIDIGVKDNTSFEKMNLGLEKRPESEISLRKEITGMIITASNGQIIINAYVGEDNELHGTIQNLARTSENGERTWRFEVSPTETSTLIDGAKIEYTYKIVATNIGQTDYLSKTLIDAFNNNTPDGYKNYLNSKAQEIKQNLLYKFGYNKNIGAYLGEQYYKGGTSSNIVATEINEIRDYLDNGFELKGELSPDVTIINDINHFILNDAWDLQPIVVKKVVKTNSTGKLLPNAFKEYSVSLYKSPLSSTGKLDFFNYVAEVMSYSNAAGRRVKSSVPGNVEAINKNINDNRSLELDEADIDAIKITPATGSDKQTRITWMITIAGGIAIIAAGAFVTKKYIIK